MITEDTGISGDFDLEAAPQRWAATRTERLNAVLASIDRGHGARTIVKHASEYFAAFNSEERAAAFLGLAGRLSSVVFWRVLR
jgi:hypothetical protein